MSDNDRALLIAGLMAIALGVLSIFAPGILPIPY